MTLTLPAHFPTLPGLTWSIGKQPEFSTLVKTAVNGAETRITHWAFPRWRYKLNYDLLRDQPNSPISDLKSLMGFFLARHGQAEPFLLHDRDDCLAVRQSLGLGDGVTTLFPAVRSLGGFIEPVGAVWPLLPWLYGPAGGRVHVISGEIRFADWRLAAAPSECLTNPELYVFASTPLGPAAVSGDSLLPTDGLPVTIAVLCDATRHSTTTVTIWDSSGAAGDHSLVITADLTQGTTTVLNNSLGGAVTPAVTSLGNGWMLLSVTLDPLPGQRYCVLTDGNGGLGTTGRAALPGPADGDDTLAAVVRVNGVALTYGTEWQWSDDGRAFVFVQPPANGAVISADFTFSFLVRFAKDVAEFTQFAHALWELRSLELVSVK